MFFTCAAAVLACSAPAPTTSAADATAASPGRTRVPEAREEPSPSAVAVAAAAAASLGDLETMRSRGLIRILVALTPTTYLISDGQQQGAVFDAGKAFESFANTTLGAGAPPIRVLFVPLPPEQLLTALTSGRGDIAAGRLAKTFEWEDVVAFSDPIATDVREVLVTGPGVSPIVSLEDVGGRSIHVRRGSDHFRSLTRLNGQLAKINKPTCTIVEADPALTDEDLLQMVNAGRVPITVVDHYLVDAWRPGLGKVSVNPDVAVSQDGVYAWAVRKESPKLLALVNAFVRTHDFRDLDARAAARHRR